MDRITAYRNFGNAGYTPTRRVKVYSDHWYLCTFQNTESNPLTDYHGLADGEYTELLPGTKAREAKFAHLNHLNKIAEYTGQVWAVIDRFTQYTTSETAASKLAAKINAGIDADHVKTLAWYDKELAKSDKELFAFYGKCKDWPEHPQRELARLKARTQADLAKCKAHYNQHRAMIECIR